MSATPGSMTLPLIATVVCVAAVAALLTRGPVAEGQEELLSPLGIELLGQREWLVGSTAALRVIITDHARNRPVAGARVSISITPAEGDKLVLHEGRTDGIGTLRASFEIPELEPGSYQLTVAARSGPHSDETTQTITLKRSTQILLTTDKPIYQPSQVIHIRALALKRPTLNAVGGSDLTLEVSDAKGNKVFKKALETNDFGIASADFVLADEVNMGRYKIRAIIGDDQAEKTVTVKRYVLPKFKVNVSTDREYYLPGENVEGKVQADYFFGKPVSGGKVAISVKTFDVEFTEIQQIEGETDDNGTFKFECALPDHFVGQPLEQGKAFLQFEVKVTDKAEHGEQSIKTSSVAASRVSINAVAESGSLVPGVENIIYVMASRPTGEPVEAMVRVEQADYQNRPLTLERSDFRTDELGIADVALAIPAGPAPPRPPLGADWVEQPPNQVRLRLAARLADGTIARKTIELSTEPGGADNLLLRVDRPLAKVGDTLNATALCSSKGGTVYFDIIKDRQTMLTQAADIEGGKAITKIRLTPEITGTAYLTAYRIMPSGQIVRDTRPMFVQAANDLSIDIKADNDTYLPGGEAKLAFAITDAKGRPVAAALGINVVDESVFALQELQPGMEKIFFYLEQELMKPRYEIHGFELPTIITKEPASRPNAERAARVVFASVEAPDVGELHVNTYAERLAKAKAQWAEEMAPTVQRIAEAIRKYQRKMNKWPPAKDGVEALIREGLLTPVQLKDLWGNELVIKSGNEEMMYRAVVISAGPDGEIDTIDDIIMVTWEPSAWFADEEDAMRPRWREAGGMMRGVGGMAQDMMARPMARAAAPSEPKGDVGAAGPPPEQSPSENGGAPAVRVREFFPETMYFEPALITDETGKATLTLSMADSITTWRLAALANSAVGQLGSTTAGLRCFQDFFVDIDLPVSLTQNDEVSIPIAVYNYLPGKQTVQLELTAADWFELKGERVQTLEIAGNEVDVRYFTFKVKQIGDHPLTVHARGSKMSDAIKRVIEVRPDGKKIETTANGRLKGAVEETIAIPKSAIPDASKLFVKIYPGMFSQVVEGLDSILRMPFGCFEQTSSVTWPNVMVLDYIRTTKQATPEIQMKAEGFINTGYQRMVAYEVDDGGFSWFGQPPANKLLTAYGLMAFHDMSAVHEVDPDIITRTQDWLLGQADEDGVYKPEEEYYHAETWGKVQVNELLPTAYVVWGLTHTGCDDPRVQKSADYVAENWKKATEPYSLAIVCNALVGADTVLHGGDLDDTTREALEALVEMAKTEGEKMWWASGISGITKSTGKSADLEATGMAVLALMRSGVYSGEAGKVLNYLIEAKDPNGTWHSTNATILAMRALMMAQKAGTSKVNGEVTVSVNGKRVSGFALTPENADVMRMIDCTQHVKPGENKVRVHFAGEGSTLYQIVGRYYLPWKGVDRPAQELLAIDVRYDKTTLKKDDTILANVTVKNNTRATTSMIIVDLGIPPGFAVDGGDFAELVGSKKIDRFNMTGRQIIVYIEEMSPRQTIEFSYSLKAKFPLRAKTPKSTVYEYYNPDNRADAEPVEMEVR